MESLKLTSAVTNAAPDPQTVFCPGVAGLSSSQADLAFLMPRMDHNRIVRETDRQGDWAAVLASDPFGSEAAMFQHLKDLGYRGVTNWPSSILLDGSLSQAMSTIPASPDFEYAYLARAEAAGLQTMAFFRSLGQARAAREAGLDHLVVHPGVLDIDSSVDAALIHGALVRLIETIRAECGAIKIYAYTSDWHEALIPLSALPVDGLVQFEVAP